MASWYSRSFPHKELMCKCCNTGLVSLKLVRKLQLVQDYLGDDKLYIVAGCQCKKRLKATEGEESHLFNMDIDGKETCAVDVRFSEGKTEMTPEERKKIVQGALEARFKSITVASDHVHLEVDRDPKDEGIKLYTKNRA